MEKVRALKRQAGRPVKAIKKEIRASVRFTKAEYFSIRNKASKAGIKASAYIREIAINGEVKMRFTEEERQFVRQIVGMSNNFNQLTKNSYKEGMLTTVFHFEAYRNRLDDLLKKFDYAK
ncbi:plasmid mobilization protein [Segetibacter aerophilus]|uniref:Bacterial mobilisation domain-containing protein n=1 Tax=Segetibacter aerophilus TaxID=670293 RepID=A0A512BGR4_9BACT|nr:hypothetical protein [Segetibacter aerophilus]GEO11153.1 hypothetical protein SAE01_36490 [Segetibacter aerophilus]